LTYCLLFKTHGCVLRLYSLRRGRALWS